MRELKEILLKWCDYHKKLNNPSVDIATKEDFYRWNYTGNPNDFIIIKFDNCIQKDIITKLFPKSDLKKVTDMYRKKINYKEKINE